MQLLIFIASLPIGIFFMNAARVLTDEGHILSFVRKYVPEQYSLSKPLYSCEYCTASFWGTLAYLLPYLMGCEGWAWPFYLVCLVGLRFELNTWIEYRKITVKQSYDL